MNLYKILFIYYYLIACSIKYKSCSNKKSYSHLKYVCEIKNFENCIRL